MSGNHFSARLWVGEVVRHPPCMKGAFAMNLLKKFLSPWVRCWHLHRGPLITCRRGEAPSPVAALTGTYCVCLDCGQHFAYDWETMKWITPAEPVAPKMTVAQAEEMYVRKAS